MNRREFFRRALPPVAVVAASASCGWSFDFFKRILRRVLSSLRTSSIEDQIAYQAKMAMRALANQTGEYVYGAGNAMGVVTEVGHRTITVQWNPA